MVKSASCKRGGRDRQPMPKLVAALTLAICLVNHTTLCSEPRNITPRIRDWNLRCQSSGGALLWRAMRQGPPGANCAAGGCRGERSGKRRNGPLPRRAAQRVPAAASAPAGPRRNQRARGLLPRRTARRAPRTPLRHSKPSDTDCAMHRKTAPCAPDKLDWTSRPGRDADAKPEPF